MKNLFKLFLAVVALFAYSCVTDTTEDLGVQVGGGQNVTEITLSLEESRTQLGEKAGALYPLLWSEGDAISVNGVSSAALTASQAGAAAATFTVEGSLATPYCIAYPATVAGQVLFAEKQTHVSGTTFGSGVTTMYGYSDGEGVQLNHLTGVLKIGVTGDKTLVMAQISTVDRAPIAGAFDIDFEKGEVTPTESSKYVINYNFPVTADAEGLTLSSEPQYIHVAVPAGEYNELYVTLYDIEGGVMYATVKADDTKPLAAGKVREFKNSILYAPNEEVFVIRDVESLQAFAAEAATLTKDVLFVADVDMTGVAWTPIEGYAGTIHGNGYAINGLTAPLFGITSASFKGLHLTNVNINETVTPNVGALARRIMLPASGISATVEHCSVSGKISVHTPNFKFDSEQGEYAPFAIGCLIGTSYGLIISDCVNEADLEVKEILDLSSIPEGKTPRPRIGGVVGALNSNGSGDATVYAKMYNLENKGDISYTDFSYTGENGISTYSPVHCYLAGVVGNHASGNLAEGEIQNIVNRGDVTLSGNFNNGCILTGTIGQYAAEDGSHVYNYGKVSYIGGTTRYLYAGAGIGYGAAGSNVSNVHNYGELYIGEEATCLSLIAGGLMAYQSGDTGEDGRIADSTNNAPVNVFCKTATENPNKTALHFRIGGLAGWNQINVNNCKNLEKGKVTVKTSIFNNDANTNNVCIGGLVGYKTVNVIRNSQNDAEVDVDVDLTITTGEEIDLTTVRANIGGLVGYSHKEILSSTNNGAVNISGTYVGDLLVGGCIGSCLGGGAHDSITNNGKVTIKGSTTVGNWLYVGGNLGESLYCRLAYNNGEICVEDGVKVTGRAFIAGNIGFTKGNCNRIYNSATGILNIGTGRSTDSAFIAGNLGWAAGETAKDIYTIENRGAITSDFGSDNYLSVTGSICYTEEFETEAKKLLSPKTHEIDNYAPITVTSSVASKRMYVGGVSRFFGGTCNNITNHETGVVNVTFNTTEHGYIGGICAQGLKDNSADCNNYADFHLSGNVYHSLYGGIIATTANNYTRTRCSNHGDIYCGVKVETGNIFIAGFVYDIGGMTMRYVDCHNTGDFIVTEECVSAGRIEIGGFVAKMENAAGVAVFDGCSNSGNFIIKGKGTKSYERYGGGVAFLSKGTVIVENGFTNSGNITYEGDHTSSNQSMSLGGFIGQAQNGVAFATEKYPTWTGDVVNTGTIRYAGKSAKNVYIGGFIAAGNNTVTPTAKLINTGTLEIDGAFPSAQVGGIYGLCKVAIDEAQVFCDIYAKSPAKAGFIMGSARTATVKATNCKIGGRFATEIDNIYNTDGDLLGEGPKYSEIAKNEFFNYIYSSVNWDGVENYDGCSHISSKDEIVYTPVVEETPAQ